MQRLHWNILLSLGVLLVLYGGKDSLFFFLYLSRALCWRLFVRLYDCLDSCVGKEIPDDGHAQRLMLYAGADHVLHKV